VRAAASALGLHHSTLQARLESLTRQLGYDPRSPLGRSRYEAARLLSRLR
jgi:DNA-binding PucR family transcriptional regulator